MCCELHSCKTNCRPWQLPEGYDGPLQPCCLLLGNGDLPLEIAMARHNQRPTKSQVENLWHRRWNRRPAPLLLVVHHPDRDHREMVTLCGVGDPPDFGRTHQREEVKKLICRALSQPDHHLSREFVEQNLPSLLEGRLGYRNQGVLPVHELDRLVEDSRIRSVWEPDQMPVSGGRNLLEELGYKVSDPRDGTSILQISDQQNPLAVAVVLFSEEHYDLPSDRHRQLSPVSQGLAVADQQRIRFVIVVRGRELRLYLSDLKTGLGRGGRQQTFFETNLDLLDENLTWLTQLMFSAESLRPDTDKEPNLNSLLDDAVTYASDLGHRLQHRVFKRILPLLASISALSQTQPTEPKDQLTGSKEEMDHLFQIAMTILFRLLFVAYAEDQGLLSYQWNPQYRRNSLREIARELTDDANYWLAKQPTRTHPSEEKTPDFSFSPDNTILWQKIRSLWQSISQGRTDWGIPYYNGGMFSSDPAESKVGAAIADLSVTDEEIGPVLYQLLVDPLESGYGMVDFRQLGAEEFGTIYEGLLEWEFVKTSPELPSGDDTEPQPETSASSSPVITGSTTEDTTDTSETPSVVPVHKSGIRRSTGTYFTPDWAVKHLLEASLRPALRQHLDRLPSLDEDPSGEQRTEALFDFRVADISMGSGHFLVAAIDMIEEEFSDYLRANPNPALDIRLAELAAVAKRELGDLADNYTIESSSLLRRMIARHCIYGVDITSLAVDLARFAVWLKTFVPGLPLSYLDHNLVCGNSLIGIGRTDEARDELTQKRIFEADASEENERYLETFYADRIDQWLNEADPHLDEFEKQDETTPDEVEKSKELDQAATKALSPLENLLDILVAHRHKDLPRLVEFTDDLEQYLRNNEEAGQLIREFEPLHFPVAFREVFRREGRSGFDCIVGNPPWEKLQFEEREWWLRKFPNLIGKTEHEKERLIADLMNSDSSLAVEQKEIEEQARTLLDLTQGGLYIESKKGSNDLFRAFCWRFHQLLASGGWLGVVLPNTALVGNQSELWRQRITQTGWFSDLTRLRNHGGWFHPQIDQRLRIALVSAYRNFSSPTEEQSTKSPITLHGPFSSETDFESNCVITRGGGGVVAVPTPNCHAPTSN